MYISGLIGICLLMQLAQEQDQWHLPSARVNELRLQAPSERTRNSHPESIAARTRGRGSRGSSGGGAPSSSVRGTQRKQEGRPAQAGRTSSNIVKQQVYGCDILELGELLAVGGSCKVLHGTFEGEAAAVKIYDRTDGAKDEMRRELSCYERLGQWL